MQRPLDGVLRGLVAQHGHRRVDVRATTRLHGHVEELARDHLRAAPVEDLQRRRDLGEGQSAATQQLVGPAQQQVAEQDRGGGAVLLGVAAPAGVTVLGLEAAVRRGPAAAGVGGVHQVVVDQGTGVQQLEGGACADEGVLVAQVGAYGAVSPVAEGRAEPLASRDRRTRLGDQPRSVRAEGLEHSALLVDEGIEGRLDIVAEGCVVPVGHAQRLVSGRAPAVAGPVPRLLRMANEQARRIGDLVREGERSFSFEFFPPKDEAGEAQLWQAIRELEPYRPTFVSVTYGAGGTTRDTTVRVTGRIARETSLTAMAHLTCVGHTRAELDGVLDTYADAGIGNVMVLRGDPAEGPRAAVGADQGRIHVRRGARRARPASAATSASGWRRSPRVIRPRTRSTTTPTCWSPRRGPGPSSRSPRCSSAPRTTSGWSSGSAPAASTCRSCPASCRS